jgi:hypothetical protein
MGARTIHLRATLGGWATLNGVSHSWVPHPLGVGLSKGTCFDFSTHFHSLTKPSQSPQLHQTSRLPPVSFESTPPHSNDLLSTLTY